MSTSKAPGKRAPLTPAEKAKREATKVANFNRMATPRVKRAKKAIELVGNLSNNGYTSTKEQVEKIRKILQTALDQTMARFDRTSGGEDDIVI